MTKFVAACAVFLLLTVSPAAARPAGCPSLWCGCYMALKKGYTIAQAKALGLFRARTWGERFQRVALAPGTIAVFARGRGGGHVGEVLDVRPGQVLLHSGNDGRTVRTRWRSTKGLIAAVNAGEPVSHAVAAKAVKKIRYAKRHKYRVRVAAHKVQRPVLFATVHSPS